MRNKNTKGISKSCSKNIKFEECKKFWDGEKHQDQCENYFLRSVNHEMYLQKMKKRLLYLFSKINDVISMKLKVYLELVLIIGRRDKRSF